MTAEMIMVSTWVTDSLFVWILLELLELGLYFYLILGILPGIKKYGKNRQDHFENCIFGYGCADWNKVQNRHNI